MYAREDKCIGYKTVQSGRHSKIRNNIFIKAVYTNVIFLTLTSSGQSLEQSPLSTEEDRDDRVRHVAQRVLHVQHSDGVANLPSGHCIKMHQAGQTQSS